MPIGASSVHAQNQPEPHHGVGLTSSLSGRETAC